MAKIKQISINNTVYEIEDANAQPALVSGTNIKTINNTSLLGSGNISAVSDVKQDNVSLVTNHVANIPHDVLQLDGWDFDTDMGGGSITDEQYAVIIQAAADHKLIKAGETLLTVYEDTDYYIVCGMTPNDLAGELAVKALKITKESFSGEHYLENGGLISASTIGQQILTALSSYVPNSRTINDKALTSNVTLKAGDVKLSSAINSDEYTTNDTTQQVLEGINTKVNGTRTDITAIQSEITDIQANTVAKDSTNLVDWDNVSILSNKYYKGSNGVLATGTSDHKALPKIKVKPSTKYYLSCIKGGLVSGLGSSTEVATCFYDSSDSFISSVNGADLCFTTPSNAAYIGISLYKYNEVTEPCFQYGSVRKYSAYNPISGYDDTIVENDTVFFDRTKNLFDYTKAITGYYINANGNQSSSASYSATDYIQIEPNEEYVTSNYYGSGGSANAFYDKNLQFISSFKSVPAAIPSNAAYVRFTISGTSESRLKDVQVEYGQENTPYEPYGYKLKAKYLTDEETQKISMPKKLYILSGVNNDIFYEPIVKRWNPYKYDVKVTTSVYRDYVKAIKRVCTLNDPTSTTITFDVYDSEKERYVANISCDIVKGTNSVGSETVKIGIIGDSYTDGGCFTPALLANGYVPNLQMVGTRSVNNSNYATQRLDGRSGWSLRNFCNVQTGADYFNPFYHPQGTHRYWGNTAFWANVCGGNPSGYGTRYTHYASLCDSSGFPVSPTDGDVIYDSTNSVFKEYQSGSWVQVATTVAAVKEYYTWEFNYQKYLTMWSVDTADIFCVYLGVNDYWVNEPTDESLAEWKTLMDAIITSYHSVNATGKFVILCTNTVTNPNVNHYQPLDVHRRMWKLRNFIIENYDQRESELIYTVDTAHLIDSENSFTLNETTPFDGYPNGYTYSNKEIWAGDGQHPRVSYTTLGYSLAAFIQYHRS